MSWSRRRKKWVAVGLVVITAVILASAALLWVPIAEEQSGYTMIGLRLYSFEAVNIYNSAWANFSYRGVLFEFPPAICPQNTGGGDLCGSFVESSGQTFSFDIVLPPPCHRIGSWLTWVSPTSHEAIEIEVCTGGIGPTHLLVST